MKYRYSKKAGALQEAFEENHAEQVQQQLAPAQNMMSSLAFQSEEPFFRDEAAITAEGIRLPPEMLGNVAHGTAQAAPAAQRLRRGLIEARRPDADPNGLDHTHNTTEFTGMFFYTVEDGQRVLVVEKSGEISVVEGPQRFWAKGKSVRPMQHYVAHPGDFLIVRYRDGRQEHLVGPAHLWFDPREHMGVTKEEALPISAKEAVVVYSQDDEDDQISRRIVHGPASFVPKPGEWLHTFSWHGTAPGVDGYRKIPNSLVFQKLWLMPDQMYHDVTDVRTADDAVLTIRLMLFFELRDIDEMLATTHDPIGDFINAATSDVMEFMSRHNLASFKQNTDKLNDLATYKQLTARADQCGYHIDKVVYRGYGATARLQKMHDEAIESRTRLQLQRATEQQAQELADFQLERDLERNATRRQDERQNIEHEIQIADQRQQAQLQAQRNQREFVRQQARADAEFDQHKKEAAKEAQRRHLAELKELGVDLTALLTQNRADQVIELRGGANVSPHLHLPESD